MKRLPLSLLVCVCSFSSPGLRAESSPAVETLPEATWSVTPAVTSQYLFRGVRVAGASFQPGVDFAYGPLALGLWSSVALEGTPSGDSDPEIDFYGYYTIPVTQRWADIEFLPGLQVYTYPDAEREEGCYPVTVEPSLALNVTLAGIRFTPKVYYDCMLKGPTVEFAAAVALPLTTWGTEIHLGATAGTFKWEETAARTSPSVKNWGDYWTISAAIPYQVTTTSRIAVAVLYSEGRNNYIKQGSAPRERNEAAGSRAAVTLSYTIDL